jgi:Flp pilus assembly protein protease CpaA
MIATAGFGALLVCASCFDVLRLRIPNIIPLGLVVLFAFRLLVEPGIDAPLEHFAAMALTLLILLPVFAFDMLGGGDIKLLSAVALWLGMPKLGALLILVGLLGGIFALFWLGMRWCIRTGRSDRPVSQRAELLRPARDVADEPGDDGRGPQGQDERHRRLLVGGQPCAGQPADAARPADR